MRLALQLAASTGLAAVLSATPAYALFGPTCVPRLTNCNCTFMVPCPVNDRNANSTRSDYVQILKSRTEELKKLTTANRDFANRSGAPLDNIAGLGAIGFNFTDMIEAKIDELNGVLGDIQTKIRSVGLTAQDFASQLQSGTLYEKINSANLTNVDLDRLGLSQASIAALKSGSLQGASLLETAKAFGAQGELLKSAGIDETALQELMSGSINIDQLETRLKGTTGLSLNDLERNGFNIPAIRELSQLRSEDALSAAIGQLGLRDYSSMGDLGQIQAMLSGSVDPSQMFSLALKSGLNIPSLKAAGVSDATLIAFKTGRFDANQLIEFSSAIGLQKEAFASLGIDSGLITAIAEGKANPSQLYQIALSKGVSAQTLSKMGLSVDKLTELANTKDVLGALQLLDSSGLSSNPLKGFGITSYEIAAVAQGKLDPQVIGTKLAQQGIDPRSIVLPTSFGSAVNGLGQAVSIGESTLNIPLDSFGGLKSAIQQVTGDSSLSKYISKSNVAQAMSRQAGFDISSPEYISALLSGQASTNDLLEFANSMGISDQALMSANLSSNTLAAIKTGSFTGSQIIELSRVLGFGDKITEAMGIGPSQIDALLNGTITVENFRDAASAVGITAQDLNRLGLPQEVLSKISSGDAKVAEDTRSALKTDGDGLISVASNSVLSNDPSTIETAPTEIISPVCLPGSGLITDSTPPNDWGTSVADIDYAISNGDPTLFEESLREAEMMSGTQFATTMARSIQIKNIIPDAIKQIDYYKAQLDIDRPPSEMISLLGQIHRQRATVDAEITSLTTFLVSTQASDAIGIENFIPVPILPHDELYRTQVDEKAQEAKRAIAVEANKLSEVAFKRSDFGKEYRQVAQALDRLKTHREIEKSQEDLAQHIMDHEILKTHKYHLESLIRSSVIDLYADPTKATALILSALIEGSKTTANDLHDPQRWQKTANLAFDLDSEITAGGSRFGSRLIEYTEEGQTYYTQAPLAGYSFHEVDKDSADNPYRIIVPQRSNEDPEPLPPMAGLFQYFMEATRRESSSADWRRGAAPYTMSNTAWTEFSQFAPQCLIGPIEATSDNLEVRPDLFDLSPYCDHIVYQGGDAEDYISSKELGGADATLWETKIRKDLFHMEFGLGETILAAAEALLGRDETNQLVNDMNSIGMGEWATSVQTNIDTLRTQLDTLSQ